MKTKGNWGSNTLAEITTLSERQRHKQPSMQSSPTLGRCSATIVPLMLRLFCDLFQQEAESGHKKHITPA
jgi:hypothetical protein